MAVKEVNDKNFKESISKGTTMVDFFADWCGPCKMLAPIYDEVSEEVKDVNFLRIDTDENQESSSFANIMSLPTLVIYKEGQEVKRIVGLQRKEAIVNALKEA